MPMKPNELAMTDQQTALSKISGAQQRRLTAQAGEIIDRSQTFSFTFNGHTYPAHPGDTIASALAAAGVQVFSRSFKYHRPRGLLCCSGDCPNCLVQLGDEPNVRACTRPVEPGMAVSPQNVTPSLDYDVMSLMKFGARFTPVGFYYKTFIRPQFLWPLYERILRHAAGLGKVSPDTPPGNYDKQYLQADVAVVGGGRPASARRRPRRSGAREYCSLTTSRAWEGICGTPATGPLPGCRIC